MENNNSHHHQHRYDKFNFVFFFNLLFKYYNKCFCICFYRSNDKICVTISNAEIEEDNTPDYLHFTSTTSNHNEDDVPSGSILVSSFSEKIQNVWHYTRMWKTSPFFTIKGITYLDGTSCLTKIYILFDHCDIDHKWITYIEQMNQCSVNVHFYNKRQKQIAKILITKFININNYTNLVYI